MTFFDKIKDVTDLNNSSIEKALKYLLRVSLQ